MTIPFRYEYEILSADGQRKWVLELAQGVYNSDGTVEALEGIIIDITGVRLINDAFGYSEGDKLIVETSKLLQIFCRCSDILARMGGDEFALLMPNTDKKPQISLIIPSANYATPLTKTMWASYTISAFQADWLQKRQLPRASLRSRNLLMNT